MASSVHDNSLPMLDRLRYWKLHVPFLYDMCVVHRMNSPVVAAAWLPGDSPDEQRFMIATRRFERRRDQHNCVFTGTLRAPLEEDGGWDNDGEYAEVTEDSVDETGHSGPGNSQGGIDIVNRILLPEDVFRVKVSPNSSSLLAVQMSGGTLWMLNSEAQGDVKPLIELNGLDREGFGLEFHNQRQNMLLSASFSGRTCVWDVSGSSTALWSAKNVQAQIEDCCWCPSIPSSQVLATVASDNHLRLYDTRCSGDPVSVMKQASPFLCCACSPLSNLLVTGRQDSIISVFDPRRMGGGDVLCGSLTFHPSAVYTIAFHPFRCNLFATGDADGQVAIWDLNRSHLMQPHSELKNGHVCLGFVHGGHKERVTDMAWSPNPHQDWSLMSADDSGEVHFWQISKDVTDVLDVVPDQDFLFKISATQQNLKQIVEESRNESIICDFTIQPSPSLDVQSVESLSAASVVASVVAANSSDEVVNNLSPFVPNTNCNLGDKAQHS